MEKLGPGSNSDTLKVLAMIPKNAFPVIVDAGCGLGRQTMVLANQLQTMVHAVDASGAYLERLARYLQECCMEDLVQPHCMDMADIPSVFPEIDLLWSECSAYHIGFENALRTWLPAIKPGGYAVISELSWLHDQIPAEVRQYLQSGYPEMRSVDQNISLVKAAGYELLATHVLPRAAWIDGYYEKQVPLAQSLLNHAEQAVREFAFQTLEGIRIFDCSNDSYSYVFYVLRKPE